eukprot:1702969-Pyramimonas_sp.AAC.1
MSRHHLRITSPKLLMPQNCAGVGYVARLIFIAWSGRRELQPAPRTLIRSWNDRALFHPRQGISA